ncbi:MAG TPA: hypothetical protein VNI20_12520 [Fimbriimonadaceae bacterium]|nr:hypothetical protein [Fimbriimonadaceae bacterium]
MKAVSFGAIGLLLLVQPGGYRGRQTQEDPVVVLERGMESRAWVPPKTSLPKEFVDVAKFMFAHGLADPSGGSLRLAKVRTFSDSSGREQDREVAGWVLPQEVDGQSLIVSMGGLIYRCIEVEGPTTVAELTKGEFKSHFVLSPVQGDEKDPRSCTVAVALLLKAGLVEDAERIFDDRFKNAAGEYGSLLVNDYATRRFMRAVGAHMFGDDRLAQRDSGSLNRNLADLKVEYLASPPKGAALDQENVLGYLAPVESLYSDSSRRLFVMRPKLDLDSLKPLPIDRKVSTLIYYLDDVSARQLSQPGGVTLAMDPIVEALIKIGDQAVEPLLEVYEGDQRLTRSVSYFRDFAPGRNLISVKSAARAALEGILQYPGVGSGPGGRPTAKELRDYWRTFKGVPLVERKYAELKDDIASPEQWLNAADFITERTNVQRLDQYTTRAIDPKPGQAFGFRGEPLRDGRSPSVTELMTKRIHQVMGSDDFRNSSSYFQLDKAVRLEKMLFNWDPRGSMASLKELTERIKSAPGPSRYQMSQLIREVPDLSFLTVCRLRLEDESAADDYASFLERVERGTGFFEFEASFAPLYLFPGNARLQELSRMLFADEASSWHPVHAQMGLSLSEFGTRLLEVPAYRKSVLGLLSDRAVVGKVSFVDDRYKYELDKHMGAGGPPITRDEAESLQLKPTGDLPLRVCDVVAYALTRLKGAPTFSPVWPEGKKDASMAKIRAFIEENVDRLPELLAKPAYFHHEDWITNAPIPHL